ncbi:chaperonin 10-like protein [Macrophomina phaseolina]|uniref:Chaperonin 10-like protein n=1 Tax=Macrophomina phaseolina TaxID=35725 RepID=A0ABQ8G1K1_9PEZI|nr:chaperonin 10-like protein [Macrophomina phaseolina]
MKEAITDGKQVEIIDSPIPAPGPDQVIIQVMASGCNPKDWKMPEMFTPGINSGDDIAGVVYATGANVYEFKPGDRVAAFHELQAPGGSFAEYAVALAVHDEASTIPLAALTAFMGNYVHLGLPEPWKPATEKLPFLVYGAATAVGAFAIKLAWLSNIHPIIGAAGRGIPFAESLIDNQRATDALRASGAAQLYHAFDAVVGNGSHTNVVEVLAPESRVTYVLPLELTAPPGFRYPDTYKAAGFTNVQDAYGANKQEGFIYLRWIFRMMMEGKLTAHPHEVIPGGLAGVGQALQNLKSGKASAVKYVFRVPETEGAGQD